jgi:signal transduction histidine kinase
LFLPEDRPSAHSALTAPLDDDARSSQSAVVHLKPADGAELRAIELTFTLASRGGEIALLSAGASKRVGVCRDVTEQRRHYEQSPHLSAGMLAERDRSDFLSRISHELRTPLNGILGYAQLMTLDREHPLPQAQLHRLRVLQESGTRLLSMIDQLLAIRGIDQGEVTLHPEVVDVVPLIARCVGHVQSFAQARSIDIDVALIDEQVAHVRADPRALEQVVHALLSNAIKFNRSPGRVRIRFVSAEMGTILIDDTGVGLTPKKLSQLFQPLNRLGAEREGIPGRGLGLITARKLTQAMGGALKAWSQVGTGSRFAVSLVLAKPQRPVGAPESGFTSLEPSEGEGAIQRVVLYVEDDEVNTALMEQVFLMRPEWRLITAVNGEDGLSAAMAHQPELMLIDIGLPDMSGVEVLKKIKSDVHTQSIRCVALSADTSAESVHRARDAGFEAYWTKPFDILGMVGQLKSLLG